MQISLAERNRFVCILLVAVVATVAGTPAAATPSTFDSRIGLRAELAYGILIDKETRYTAGTFERALEDSEQRRRLHDPWLGFDKVQHFTFSALFTVGGQYALVSKFDWRERQALPISILSSFTIGLTKELYDWQAGPNRFFSWRDMTANGLGILVATGFILL